MSDFPKNALDLLKIGIYLWIGVFIIAFIGLEVIPWFLGTTISIIPVYPDISLNSFVLGYIIILILLIIGEVLLYYKYKNKKIILLLLIPIILLSFLIITDVTIVDNVSISREGNVYTLNYDSYSLGGNYHSIDVSVLNNYGHWENFYHYNYPNPTPFEFPTNDGSSSKLMFENDISHLFGFDIDNIPVINN